MDPIFRHLLQIFLPS
ncbi:unnamed protein product [Diabrotica balteata]|uniref:Uncharacterized protein n=1 Tax=Diabrotica balteata TaxID=107213 RepID=A0A9N9SVV7_DIABA|nr:unnamed protein product [Diabrotica balteata]